MHLHRGGTGRVEAAAELESVARLGHGQGVLDLREKIPCKDITGRSRTRLGKDTT